MNLRGNRQPFNNSVVDVGHMGCAYDAWELKFSMPKGTEGRLGLVLWKSGG